MQRVLSDKLGRLYHDALYQRMITFAERYTPEFPAEPIVNQWLKRLYDHDLSLHILIDSDNGITLDGHAVIDVQNIHGHTIVACHQVYRDVRTKSPKANFDEAFEYIDKLMVETNAVCSMFTVEKHSKLYQQRYGYTIARMVMIKKAPEYDTST